MGTENAEYAERLLRKQTVWWKQALRVQAPYQWNLRRQGLGPTLDVGCGIGRNLESLPHGSLGVDHNGDSVRLAREFGHSAMTVDEFMSSGRAAERAFSSLLFAHVIEHLDYEEALAILKSYLPYATVGGQVMFVCPQERGYASDPTHVRFYDFDNLESLARAAGLEPLRSWSFPFPRALGKAFIYNEFCVIASIP